MQTKVKFETNSFGGTGEEEEEGEEVIEEVKVVVGDGAMEAEDVKVGLTSENMVVEPKTEDIDGPIKTNDHIKMTQFITNMKLFESVNISRTMPTHKKFNKLYPACYNANNINKHLRHL